MAQVESLSSVASTGEGREPDPEKMLNVKVCEVRDQSSSLRDRHCVELVSICWLYQNNICWISKWTQHMFLKYEIIFSF
jgi:hypothetical protein